MKHVIAYTILTGIILFMANELYETELRRQAHIVSHGELYKETERMARSINTLNHELSQALKASHEQTGIPRAFKTVQSQPKA